MNFPILSLLTFLPLAGAFIILFAVPKHQTKLIQTVATIATLIPLVLSIFLLLHFDKTQTGLQFVEKAAWISQINVHYFLGVDGISVSMVFLSALIAFIACIASFGIENRVKEYFTLYLLLCTGMMGTFLALDLFLFYIFWEVVLVPMYFLIGIWGGPRKEYAAIKFFLYTLAGSVFMLLGILALYFNSTPHTFSIPDLTHAAFSLKLQQWLFLAFFFAFAIKVPVFPFHTWLPDAHVEAPTPISVILAGVLLKMGTYGFYRVSFPLFPEAAKSFAFWIGLLGVIGIVYGALCSMAQKDFKKMIAYSSVSHMGFILVGLSALTPGGLTGGMLQMFSHGLLTGGLFLLVGVLYDRAHTRDLDAFGGLGARVPVYAGFLTVFAMGSLGLPGLSGFVAEFVTLLGTFQVNLVQYKVFVALSCLGIVLGAGYLLWMIQKVLLGPLNKRWEKLSEINNREIFTLIPLLVLIIVIGIYPNSILQFISPSIQALVNHVGGVIQ